MMTESVGPASSLDRHSQQFSDERAAMAAERELTLDIYGASLLRLSSRDKSTTVSSTATGVDGRETGPYSTTVNGAALTGSGRKKNGFLPSGMSRGSDRSDRSGKKQQMSKKLAPVWRRLSAKQGQEPTNNHQTTANGVNVSKNFQLSTATSNNRTVSTGDKQNRAGLSGQSAVGVGETAADVRRSSSVETRSGVGQEQQSLPVILRAPAGFRDSSFEEGDEASKTAADGNLRSPRISMNADGSLSPASQGFLTNSDEAKKRPAPPVPPVQPTLQPPPMIVKDFNARKKPAPEVPVSSRSEQTKATTSPGINQSGVTQLQTEAGDKSAVDAGKVAIPNVFQKSKSQSNASNLQSSSKPELGSTSSIFRRSSFIRHLETVVGRNTPTSSAVSTMTRGADRENGMHNSSAPGEQSSGSLVSQLFHSALLDHDDSSGKKKYKFLVPDIDIPAESTAQQPADVDDDGTVPSSRVRRGFSYLKDVDVAAEVTRRAADMTARRPHESVEEAKTMRDNHDRTEGKKAMLKAARARLHAPQAQARSDLPAAATSSSNSDNRKQMLQDIVDAARRRAKKNGMGVAEDNYLPEDVAEVEKNQNYPDERTQNQLRDSYGASEKHLQQNTNEFISSTTFQARTSRDVTESKDEISFYNRPEVMDGVSQTSAVVDKRQSTVGHERKAPDYYHVPAAPNFSSSRTDRQATGITSYRAARHAHRDDIDRQLNAAEDRLAADDVPYSASVRNTSYLSSTSAAPVANTRADSGFGIRRSPSLDDFQSRSQAQRLPASSSSSDEDLDSWWIDDDEERKDAGYTVSIVGGQVRAQRWDDRLHSQRSAARNHRRRSSLRRRPRVRERPISVEIWSSGDEGESTLKDDRPRRRRFIANHRPSPLTVDTDNNLAARPRDVIGHIRNPGVTEIIHRRMNGAEPNQETLHYFSDPELKVGPYRTGAYVSQSDVYLNSPASLNFVAPENDTIKSGRQTLSTVPLHTISFPVSQRRVQPVASIDPQLADVGTKNRRYFVQMRLNAARSGREVTGAGSGGSSSNSGGSNSGRMVTRSWYGSAPQLLQLTDDVTDQYAGARYNTLGGTSFSAMQPNVRHATVCDVTSTADQGASLLVGRPQSTLPWTDGGGAATGRHVLRSITSSRSPVAAVRVDAAERRRPVNVLNGDVNRSTVEFDVELEHAQPAEMDDGRRSRLLASVHNNGLSGQRSTSSPLYSIQLNDTMRFDIDGASDRRRLYQPATSPPTYDHVRQRRQRRHRPPDDELTTTERQRTLVDVRPPSKPPRRRRQVPVDYDDSRPLPKSNYISIDDEVIDDEVYGVMNHNAETRRSAMTTRADRQPSTHVSNDLPRVVRGSILIRNSIDTTGTPLHIDVVTADSDAASDADFVVEDNTNMFHGLYRQSRENPIYLSDTELSPDEADRPATNSVPYVSTRSQQTRRQEGRAKNTTSMVDDFDKNVKISRGT